MARLIIERYNAANATKTGDVANATGVGFTRTMNGTESITFALPRDDPDIANLTLGSVVRVHDTVDDAVLAAGVVAGPLNISTAGWVVVNCVGLSARLRHVIFPPEYMLSGALADNKSSFVRSHHWRRVTAVLPAAITWDGDEVQSFTGDTGSGDTDDYLLIDQTGGRDNLVLWDRIESGDVDEAGGILTLNGTASGSDYIPPWDNVAGVYESPVLDFGSALTVWDRLRIGGGWQSTELTFRVGEFAAKGGSRAFSGGQQTPSQPEGIGEDISALLPVGRRYVAVEFAMDAINPNDLTPVVTWFEFLGQRAVTGITVGTCPSTDIEDNLTVGGQALISALDRLCETYELEWRVSTAGVLDVQAVPAAGAVGTVWGTDHVAAGPYNLIEGHHAEITEYSADDSELANYVIAQGTGGGLNAIEVVLQDAASQTAYGVRQKVVQFHEDTVDELNDRAAEYLASHKDPGIRMTVRVVRTPDDTWTFEPGDLVRIVSGDTLDHDGVLVDETFRVLGERRLETSTGVSVELNLETKPKRFLRKLARSINDLRGAVGRSIEHTEMDTLWTPEQTDQSVHTVTVPLDFRPIVASAWVAEVEDTTAGTFYSAHGSATQIEVVNVTRGERSITIHYQQVGGTNDYKAFIAWHASGRIQRAAQLYT